MIKTDYDNCSICKLNEAKINRGTWIPQKCRETEMYATPHQCTNNRINAKCDNIKTTVLYVPHCTSLDCTLHCTALHSFITAKYSVECEQYSSVQ